MADNSNSNCCQKRPRLRPHTRQPQHQPSPSATHLVLLACIYCLLHSSTCSALRILLTNDDGIEKPGIQILKEALIEDGHDVHVFAPAADRTGLAASVSLSLPFVDLGNQEVIVQGPPASCVVAGLSFMEQGLLSTSSAETQTDAATVAPVGTPDLVLVGISDGFPTGAQTLHSGSVGAALTGLARNIPTITVAALPPAQNPEEYLNNVADFTVRFLNQWVNTFPLNDQQQQHQGIKIAYPPIYDPQEIQGVQLADNGRQAPISLGYTPSPEDPTVYQISPVVNTQPIHQDTESAIVDGGSISVLPISYRYYVLERDFNVRYILTLKRMLQGLQP